MEKIIIKSCIILIGSAIILCFCLINTVNANENINKMVEKNLKSNELKYSSIDNQYKKTNKIEGYNPMAKIQTRSIIGDDDRIKIEDTTVFPYSAIAYLEGYFPDGTVSHGTAAFFDRDNVITAAHCIYDASHGGWAKSATVWPGKNGFGIWNNPYGTAKAINIAAPQAWLDDSTNIENRVNDWAILTLDSNLR